MVFFLQFLYIIPPMFSNHKTNNQTKQETFLSLTKILVHQIWWQHQKFVNNFFFLSLFLSFPYNLTTLFDLETTLDPHFILHIWYSQLISFVLLFFLSSLNKVITSKLWHWYLQHHIWHYWENPIQL